MSDAGITEMVLDALKPRETTLVDLSRNLCLVDGVKEVKITVREVDEKTETVRINLIGENINYESIIEVARELGTAIRSIDEIVYSRALS